MGELMKQFNKQTLSNNLVNNSLEHTFRIIFLKLIDKQFCNNVCKTSF